MQTPTIKFEIPGFQLSTDYEKLWNLVQNNHRVPAWVLYDEGYDRPIFDIVEVKKLRDYDQYLIGTRGRGYEGEQTKEGFIQCCKCFYLHFIEPFSPIADGINICNGSLAQLVKPLTKAEKLDIINNNSKNV